MVFRDPNVISREKKASFLTSSASSLQQGKRPMNSAPSPLISGCDVTPLTATVSMEMQAKQDTSSDDQLRRALLAKGVEAGPITDTTRQLYENKLRRLLLAEQGGAGTEEPRPQTEPEVSSQVPSRSSATPLPPPSSSSSPLLQSPCLKDNQLVSTSDGVVRDLMLQLDNPQHLSNDMAIIFPREGEVVYACRGLLAIRCAHMTPLLYNLDGEWSCVYP